MPSKATYILQKKFEEGRQRNANWSKRAFAQKIGLSSGALSEILSGKRGLSATTKKRLATQLHLSPQEQIDFFEDELPLHLLHRKLDYVKLSDDEFHVVSDWWHFAILNLVKTSGFKPFPEWIASRLDIKPKLAEEAIARLVRLGFLVRGKRGQLIRKQIRLETSDGVRNLSVQKSHIEDLKLIERSLLRTPIELRDHTSMTVVLNKSDIPKAKELVRIFQDSFSDRIEAQGHEEVYKLCIALFPLTNLELS